MRKQIVAISEETSRRNPKAEAEAIAPAVNEEALLLDAKTIMVYRRDESGTMENNDFLTRLNYPLADGLLIEEIIQQLHGAGRYRVEYRNSKGHIIHVNGDLGIGDPPKPKDDPMHADMHQAASSLTPQQITAAIISGLQQTKSQEPSLDQLLQTAKLLKELNGTPASQKSLVEQIKELREVERLIAPKPEPVKPQEPQEPDPTTAVLKMLTNNPETAKTIQTQLASLFTGENPIHEKETSWVDIGVELVKNLTPLLAPVLLSRLTGQGGNTSQPQQEQAQPDASQEPQQPPPHIINYQHLIARILYGIENGFTPEYIGEEIGKAMEADLQLEQMIGGILDTDVNLIHSQLAQLPFPNAKRIMDMPHAKQWLADLQSYFLEEPESDTDASPNAGGIVGQGNAPKNAAAGG